MQLTRKQFLRLSGTSILGFSLFSSASASTGSKYQPKISGTGPMKIEIKTKRLDLAHTWTISRNSSSFKNNVFVRVERDGIVGYGEAAPNVRYNEDYKKTTSRIQGAEDILKKNSFFHYVDIKKEIDARITDQSCAKAAIDIALMDWFGKTLNVPLYKLWGLNTAEAPLTSFTIGIDTAEMIKKKVREAAPYPLLKVKVGTNRDKEIINAVRSVTKDKPIRVDANEGWKTKEVALENIKWLMDQGVEFIEQPMPASMIKETAWLREHVNIPIIADEAVLTANDIPKLVGAYDGINIKLMKSGGLQEALRMIFMAKAYGMKIMLGCMIESSVGISAAAQLTPFVDYADLDGNLLIKNDPFSGVKVDHGKFIFNDKPGLGVEGTF